MATVGALAKMMFRLAVLLAVVLSAAVLQAANAQNGPACQAGIDKDKNTIAQIKAIRQKHMDAISSDDYCGQLGASKEMMKITQGRLSTLEQIAVDCKGFHNQDGDLINDVNRKIMDIVISRINSLEKETADEQEDCDAARAAAVQKKPASPQVGLTTSFVRTCAGGGDCKGAPATSTGSNPGSPAKPAPKSKPSDVTGTKGASGNPPPASAGTNLSRSAQ